MELATTKTRLVEKLRDTKLIYVRIRVEISKLLKFEIFFDFCQGRN